MPELLLAASGAMLLGLGYAGRILHVQTVAFLQERRADKAKSKEWGGDDDKETTAWDTDPKLKTVSEWMGATARGTAKVVVGRHRSAEEPTVRWILPPSVEATQGFGAGRDLLRAQTEWT